MNITRADWNTLNANRSAVSREQYQRIASDEIARQIAAYEARGGVIHVIPRGVGVSAQLHQQFVEQRANQTRRRMAANGKANATA